MAMVCPQCQSAFEQRLHCPQCDVRLVYRESRRGGGRRLFSGWQQTPWGRVLIGLLLAQGLYYGLRHLCVAGLLAANMVAAETLWTSLTGLLLIQGLQIVSLSIGGLFAGAGQRKGALYGAVLGIWNGVLLALVQPDQLPLLGPVSRYGQPLLQVGIGVLAGWLGGQVWKPLSVPGEAEPLRKLPKAPPRKPAPLFAGPVAWLRVGMGALVALGGTLWADRLLEWVISASDNRLTPGTHMQAQLVTWEIMALAMFAGGTLAGATTPNGVKQGLAVGLVTAVVLVGLRLGGSAPALEAVILCVAGPSICGIGGGAFGGRLFPPLSPHSRRRSFETL